MLLLLAAAVACDASVGNIVVGTAPNCPNGVAPGDVELYVGEEFQLCGDVYLKGELLMAGTVNGSAEGVMDAREPIVNGRFSLRGMAREKEHKYHYISIALEQPCGKVFEPVPLEIRDSCIMMPPSTIEAVPDVVVPGQDFTLQVKNAPRDLRMELSGLSTPVTALISGGGKWSQSFASEQCSAMGSCIIHFDFTSTEHALCTASADVVVTVKAPAATPPAGDDDDQTLLFVTLALLIVGTGGAVIFNRYL